MKCVVVKSSYLHGKPWSLPKLLGEPLLAEDELRRALIDKKRADARLQKAREAMAEAERVGWTFLENANVQVLA